MSRPNAGKVFPLAAVTSPRPIARRAKKYANTLGHTAVHWKSVFKSKAILNAGVACLLHSASVQASGRAKRSKPRTALSSALNQVFARVTCRPFLNHAVRPRARFVPPESTQHDCLRRNGLEHQFVPQQTTIAASGVSDSPKDAVYPQSPRARLGCGVCKISTRGHGTSTSSSQGHCSSFWFTTGHVLVSHAYSGSA